MQIFPHLIVSTHTHACARAHTHTHMQKVSEKSYMISNLAFYSPMYIINAFDTEMKLTYLACIIPLLLFFFIFFLDYIYFFLSWELINLTAVIDFFSSSLSCFCRLYTAYSASIAFSGWLTKDPMPISCEQNGCWYGNKDAIRKRKKKQSLCCVCVL